MLAQIAYDVPPARKAHPTSSSKVPPEPAVDWTSQTMLTEQGTYLISKELRTFTNQMYHVLKSNLFSFPMELSHSNVYYSQHRQCEIRRCHGVYEENA
jgi:hypothetical protein